MRKTLVLVLGVCLLAFFIGSASARDVRKDELRAMKDWSADEYDLDQTSRDLYTAAQVDTYLIVWYDFETMDWDGWTQFDKTEQIDTFWHVEDYVGSGLSVDAPVPLNDLKSMWCGARANPTDPYMCSWLDAPGYGASWRQALLTTAFEFEGVLRFGYHGFFDSEAGWDQTFVEYDSGGDTWVTVEEGLAYDSNTLEIRAEHELFLAQTRTKLRFRFESDDNTNDQDGRLDTDGGAHVDSLVISDNGGTVDYEDFETSTVGSTASDGIWYGDILDPFGDYSGLWSNLEDKDPCGDNFATQVVFFVGSPEPSGTYPGLYDTPFCVGGWAVPPCQDNIIISPVIDMKKYSTNRDEVQDGTISDAVSATLGGSQLYFTVYRDIPRVNRVYYQWHLRNIIDGCPTFWRDDNYVYYGPDQDYIQSLFDVSDHLTDDPMQIALGARDMCAIWGTEGQCVNHTPSPWIDNVRFQRYATTGPQWNRRDLESFQDNFPGGTSIESYIRADCANDVAPQTDIARIDPGDSMTIDCVSPLGGGIRWSFLGSDSLPDVEFHCRITYIGPSSSPKTPPSGAILEGTYGKYDAASSGGGWEVFRCEEAVNQAGTIVQGVYMIDLNDSLFTRGFQIDYYFIAWDSSNASSTMPVFADQGVYYEWTCLPTLNSDILFVDDFHGRGGIIGNVERYFNPAFSAVFPQYPDRYDVNNPSSNIWNGPASRARREHLSQAYEKIIWDSGDLDTYTIGDGTEDGKDNDCQLLVDYLDLTEHDIGLWILGQDTAWDLAEQKSSAVATELLSTFCGVDYQGKSYYDLTGGREAGGVVTPLVKGVSGGPFWLGTETFPDTCYVFGGCPIINSFDYVEKTADGEYALQYPDWLDEPYYAGIWVEAPNSATPAATYKTLWCCFSFMHIRDAEPPLPGDGIVANRMLQHVMMWMDNPYNTDITGTETPKHTYSLSQNYPNPFNPTTELLFSMRTKGHVSLKIYNVAGQLVKTLVNEVRDAGPHREVWDGTNNLGTNVASGVYFYKMQTNDFSQTKKMVLLR
jgi:hypothetical protein